MKKTFLILLAVMLSGCGGSSDTATTPPDTTAQEQTVEKSTISATILDNADIAAEFSHGEIFFEEVEISDDAIPLTKTPSANKTYGEKITELVNKERAAVGLPPLTLDADLTEAAQIRAQEIKSKFSHTRPDGSICFTVLEEMQIPHLSAAENIAGKIKSPEKAVQAWMQSEGHRNNILNEEYNSIGVGYTEGGYWSQLFTD